MVELEGNYINLRPLILEDLAFLYTIENDESLWELSQVQTPFSKDVLQTYLETAHNDIKLLKQLRLVITSKTNEPIGFIDLFDLSVIFSWLIVSYQINSSLFPFIHGFAKCRLC